ncbi:MAG: PAS domain-containing sensor histidine kinase [Candidatus Lokiarchaeota archaeon]|nr:PAS domain-containing sensor histidine kinase [Candidatus Lokiarchaeota archaeon]
MNEKNSLSETFESKVLDSISEHVIYYNKDFEIKWANRTAADSVNLSPLELIGKKCYSIWQNRISPCENCPVLDALNTGKSNSVEMTTPDGRVWLVKGYPVYNINKEITGAVEITREITDLKETEKKLRDSEEKYRNLVNNILDQIIETELDGTITYVSPQVYDIFGYKPEEVIGRRSIQFVHPDDINIVKEAMEKAVKSGEKISLEIRLKHKNGIYVNIASRGQLIKRGNYHKLIAVIRDITAQKKAGKLLKELEEKFRTLAEQSFLGIAIIQDNLTKYVNERLTETFGYSIDEIMSWQPGEFLKTIHPDDIKFVVEQVRKKQLGEPNTVDQYQFRGLKKNGDTIWLEVFSKTINYEGKLADFVTLIDITEKKIAEEKLKKSEKEYREAFNRSNFYKDLIAHDINNILQNILSSVELSFLYVDEGKDLNELKPLLKLSKEQVSRGANLISNIRKLSELEETKFITQPVEATKVLNKSIEFLLKSYQDKKINVDIENPYKVITVQGNELLTDVFENILINAVKHNQNSSVEIKIKVSKIQKDGLEFVKFEFEDNGIGIPDANKQIIFQRAYNIDRTIGGMGIGLSLVKIILTTYNGQIWVEDKVQGDYSKGSNFIVLIPEAETK